MPPEPTSIPPGNDPTQPGDLETTTVTQVVDGDTIEPTDGRKVRYIGMNTPEWNQPYYDKAVQLEFDQDTFDKYGRTLAYIWVDGMLINLEILRQGFANA